MTPMVAVLVGVVVAYCVFLIVGIWLEPKLALRRHHARLRAMDVAALALEARRCADTMGMRAHFHEARLFSDHESWTRESLASALDDLYADLAEEDRKTAERGPGSWVYSWHDCSLAFIRQALDEPTKLL